MGDKKVIKLGSTYKFVKDESVKGKLTKGINGRYNMVFQDGSIEPDISFDILQTDWELSDESNDGWDELVLWMKKYYLRKIPKISFDKYENRFAVGEIVFCREGKIMSKSCMPIAYGVSFERMRKIIKSLFEEENYEK